MCKKHNFYVKAFVGVFVRTVHCLSCVLCARYRVYIRQSLSCVRTNICTLQWAAPCLTLLPRQSGFSPRLRHLGLEMDKVAVEEVFLLALVSSLVSIIPPLLHISLYELTNWQRLSITHLSPTASITDYTGRRHFPRCQRDGWPL